MQGSQGMDAGLAALLSSVRGLSWLVGPVAPRSRLRAADSTVTLDARAGDRVEASVRITNGQRATCFVRVGMTPLVGPDGLRWHAEPGGETHVLLRPGEHRVLALRLAVPGDLPPGEYRGTLLFPAVEEGEVPVSVEVTGP